MPRLSRDQFFMSVTSSLAEQGTCKRGAVGAVIVKDRRIVSTGYNGAPPGMEHCLDADCILIGGLEGCQRATHAEANAVAFAARHGIPTDDAVMYCTHSPCIACAALMASAGIVEVVFAKLYRVQVGVNALRELGIEVRQVDGN